MNPRWFAALIWLAIAANRFSERLLMWALRSLPPGVSALSTNELDAAWQRCLFRTSNHVRDSFLNYRAAHPDTDWMTNDWIAETLKGLLQSPRPTDWLP